MINLLSSEWLKLRKSSVWLLIFISPLLASLAGFAEADAPGMEGELQWLYTLSSMAFVHALLFLPLLTGVFSAFVCRYEHLGGGWKQLLSLPVSRRNVYIVKFSLVMGLIAVSQLLFLGGLLLVAQLKGFDAPIPWKIILESIAGGWVACLPVAALQMFVSAAWSSFAAPLAINVVFTLPNILIANSETYGPFYPWAQPFLTMIPRMGEEFGALNASMETLLIVILGGFVLFFLSGLTYFQRKEI
ncbi:ABC transporter permease [Bacillus infantis]|uniref:ABC transporter permease n=1 Tax=Bacillus infantis TaxID=324767 RepID=UPI003CF9B007